MSHSLEAAVPPCSHSHRPIVPEGRARHHHGSRNGHHDQHDHDGRHERHHHHLDLHRPKQRRALIFCVILTSLMMVVEFAAGWITGSLMLISDGLHMLSHTLALGLSFFAIVLAHKKAGARLPFGLYRVEILAALLNGIGIAIFSVWIVYEAISRIFHPVTILGAELTLVAVAGLAVNFTTAVILHRAGSEDLNTKSAFLHMLADTLSSVAIVTGGIVIYFTDWFVIDPVLSMVVAVVVAKWAWDLLRDSTLILLERTPNGIDVEEMNTEVREHFPEIRDLHDLHVWEITTHYVCMSAHIVVDDMPVSETYPLRSRIDGFLRERFAISHTVLQIEC